MAKLYFHILRRHYTFTFKTGFFIFCVSFFCIFIMLSVWQFHRYHYKKELLSTYESRLSEAPKSFLTLINSTTDLQFQRTQVKGKYFNHLTLLIPRPHNDQQGYEILTPLQIENEKKLLLIDRGWIQQPKNASLPKITTPNNEQEATGYIKLINETQFILGKNNLNPNKTPLVMQRLDIAELAKMTQQFFYPFILRLDPSQPNGYLREWAIATTLPERHLGYSVQWLILAFVVLIAYFCFCCERIENAKS